MGAIDRTKVPVTCTPQEAFEVYAGLGVGRSFAQTQRTLEAAGHKVSKITIQNWAKKFRWDWRLDLNALDDMKPSEAAVLLGDIGKNIDHSVITGLLGQLIKHAHGSLEKIAIKSPGDLKVVVEVMEKLRAVAHNMRGTEINNPSLAKSNAPAGGNIVDLGDFNADDYRR